MTVRAKGKLLLENAQFTISNGRRYGLVGPNGRGKSTLLRLLAKRQIPVPDTIDVLLVEQEIVGDERWGMDEGRIALRGDCSCSSWVQPTLVAAFKQCAHSCNACKCRVISGMQHQWDVAACNHWRHIRI